MRQIDIGLPDPPDDNVIVLKNSEAPRPTIVRMTAAREDFLNISKHFHCVVFGKDFNSIFLFGARQGRFAFEIALIGNPDSIDQRDLVSRVTIMLESILSEYPVHIYANRCEFIIEGLHLDELICTVAIATVVYTSPSDVLRTLPLDSQQVCFYAGEMCASTNFVRAIRTCGFPARRPVLEAADFEHHLFDEFMKGLDVLLVGVPSPLPDLRRNLDIVTELVNEMEFGCAIKVDAATFIRFPRMIIWPLAIRGNVVECCDISWLNAYSPVRAPCKRQNSHKLLAGDLSHFYFSLAYAAHKWHLHKSYELANVDPKVMEIVLMNLPAEVSRQYETIKMACAELPVPAIEDLVEFRVHERCIVPQQWYV